MITAFLGSSASAQQSVSPSAGAFETPPRCTKQLIVAYAHGLNDNPIARTITASRRIVPVVTRVRAASAGYARSAVALLRTTASNRIPMIACLPCRRRLPSHFIFSAKLRHQRQALRWHRERRVGDGFGNQRGCHYLFLQNARCCRASQSALRQPQVVFPDCLGVVRYATRCSPALQSRQDALPSSGEISP